MEYCHLYRTDWGWGAIVKGAQGIKHVVLPEHEHETLRLILAAMYPKLDYEEKAIDPVKEALLRYFGGERVCFDFLLDLSEHTPFKRSVYAATQGIPYGEVRTYGWISDQIGRSRATRAVGQALRCNPIPIIIPCHRVVRKDGTLGGFLSRTGVDFKIRLLQLEGLNI